MTMRNIACRNEKSLPCLRQTCIAAALLVAGASQAVEIDTGTV
jgi:hypothetical protein